MSTYFVVIPLRDDPDAEYAYLIGKLGEGALERLYGVGQ